MHDKGLGVFDELENPKILQRAIQGRIQKSRLSFVVGDNRWLVGRSPADSNG